MAIPQFFRGTEAVLHANCTAGLSLNILMINIEPHQAARIGIRGRLAINSFQIRMITFLSSPAVFITASLKYGVLRRTCNQTNKILKIK